MRKLFCREASRCVRHRQTGAAAVELALVLSFLLLIAAGLIEFGRAIMYYDALSKATRDAARLMSVASATQLAASRTEAISMVRRAAAAAAVPGFSDVSGNVDVVCGPPTVSNCIVTLPSQVQTVTVGVVYPMALGEWIPFVPIRAGDGDTIAITLQPHTTMRYMQ